MPGRALQTFNCPIGGSAYGRAIRVKSGLGRGLAMVGNTARWSSGLRAASTTFYFASVALFDDTLLSDDLIPLPGKQHPDRCQ